jgi:two-component system, cell cycle response regulator CpdR
MRSPRLNLKLHLEPGMGRRVIVVDDDPLVLELTVAMLEELGCDVLQAHSGNDALEKIADDPSIEILIADINMPGLSGTELAERARSFRDELPVILLSGRESDSHGYPLIRKPVLRSDLQRMVAETSGPAKRR